MMQSQALILQVDQDQFYLQCIQETRSNLEILFGIDGTRYTSASFTHVDFFTHNRYFSIEEEEYYETWVREVT